MVFVYGYFKYNRQIIQEKQTTRQYNRNLQFLDKNAKDWLMWGAERGLKHVGNLFEGTLGMT